MKQQTKHNMGIYLQPAFLICAAVLALSGRGMSIAIERFGIYLKKEPLLLKKPLDLLDEKGLAPYRIVEKKKIENKEIIENLGTEDYIQWILEDTSESANNNVRCCLLFITYYLLPDRVPHEPEECFAGTGNQRLDTVSLTFKINQAGVEKKIPAKHLVFASTNSNYMDSDTRFSVFYLFNVNNTYTNSREKTIIFLRKNIFGKHSYYSKVEWYFLDPASGAKIYPKEEEAITASQRLLSVLLPVLEKEHWPDWNK